MTAPAVERVDLAAVERDLVAVLTAHGITGDTIQLAVYPIEQAGETVGVSISGFAYTRPPGLPTTKPATPDPFTAMAEDLEAVS